MTEQKTCFSLPVVPTTSPTWEQRAGDFAALAPLRAFKELGID